MPPKKKQSRFTGTASRTNRFKPVPMLSVRSADKMQLVAFKDDHIILNSAFGHYLDECRVHSFVILKDDKAQELALQVFTEEEAAQVSDDFWRANSQVILRPRGANKDKSRRVRALGLMQSSPWFARQMKNQDMATSRRFPVWDAGLGVYVLQASEP